MKKKVGKRTELHMVEQMFSLWWRRQRHGDGGAAELLKAYLKLAKTAQTWAFVCNLLIAQNGFNIYSFLKRLAAATQNGPLNIGFCATTRFVLFFL